MYGLNSEDPKTHLFNYYILLGKRHILLQWLELKAPNLVQFFDFVVKGDIISWTNMAAVGVCLVCLEDKY